MPLTRHRSGITILTEDVANSWYGGLFGTTEGGTLSPSSPLVAGHVHDGLHLDGHAQKVHLDNHTTGQLDGNNITNGSISALKLSFPIVETQDLAAVLILGNITNGTDIEVTNGDIIKGTDAVAASGNNGFPLIISGGLGDGAGGKGPIQTHSTGNIRGREAIDLQQTMGLPTHVASGDYSVIPGGRNNTASGASSFAMGSGSVASSSNSSAFNVSYASGAGSFSANYSFAKGTYSFSSGYQNYATGNYSFVSGSNTRTYGVASQAFGINTKTSATSDYSMAGGNNSLASHPSQIAWSSGRPTGIVTTAPSQLCMYSLMTQTTTAASSVMQFADTTNFVIRESTTYSLKGTVTARQVGGIVGAIGDSKSWEVTLMFKRGAGVIGASTSTLMSSSVVGLGQDVAAASWTLVVLVDDVTETLLPVVTGELNKGIIWHFTMQTSECSNAA